MALTMLGSAASLTIEATKCLEVRFIWHSVLQFRPVPLQIVREIWKARPMNTAFQELVMKNRRIRFDEVRTEGKLLVSLLCGWDIMNKNNLPRYADEADSQNE